MIMMITLCFNKQWTVFINIYNNGYMKTSLEKYKPQNRGKDKDYELPKNTLIAGSLVCKENDKVLYYDRTKLPIETNDIKKKKNGKRKRTDLISSDNKITNVIFIL